MNNFRVPLQDVPLSLIVLIGFGTVLFALFVPKRLGFYISLFMIGAWLNVGRFNTLPIIPAVSKLTPMIPPLLLIYCASFLPGPRRPIPLLAWVYLLTPIFGLLCIAGAADRFQGIGQFGTMFFLAAAAMMLYRVAVTNEDLMKALTALFLGLLVPIAIALFALVVYRSDSFRLGVNRFEPFGALSNQYVHFLATAACLGACGYFLAPKQWKLFCAAVVGVCVAMTIFSGSRQGIVILGIALIPAIWHARKSPIALAFGIVCCVLVAGYLFRFTDNLSSDRLSDFSSTSGRVDIAKSYVDVIMSRPLSGLMGTTGMSVTQDITQAKVPHNSYLRMGYLGGALLSVPLAIVMVASLLSCWYVWRHRARSGISPILLSMFVFLLLAIYAHGLINDMIYLSNSSWPFLHYFLSIFFMGLAKQLKTQPAYSWQYAPVHSSSVIAGYSR